MKYILHLITSIILAIIFILEGCNDGKSKTNPATDDAQEFSPVVTNSGATVTIDMKTTDQIESLPVDTRNISLELKAPARIVLSAAASSAGASPALLFESSELSDNISDYLKTRSQLEKSEKQLSRMKELVAHQAAAGKELLDAQSEVDQLKTSLSQSESKIRLSGLDLNDVLRLPAGKVILMADVPEAELRMIHKGGSAQIIFNAYPNEKFTGRISATADVIDPVTRSVKVEITVANSGGRLLAGMYGQIVLGVTQQSAATVPVSSLFTAQGKSYCFVEQRKGTFERREVVPGLQGADWVEILHGIALNDRVVTRGTMLLKGLSFGY